MVTCISCRKCDYGIFADNFISQAFFLFSENIIEGAIKIALEKCAEKGIKGKEVTPFILAAVTKATDGASLEASILLKSFRVTVNTPDVTIKDDRR